MTNRYPDSWSQLQDLVAKYFNESGYTATTERTVETVRGKVEFDVFVETQMNYPIPWYVNVNIGILLSHNKKYMHSAL